MYKVLRAGLALCLAGGAAYAGSVAYVAPVVPEVIEESTGSMGGSGAWLIPLLIIALLALAISSSDSDGGSIG